MGRMVVAVMAKAKRTRVNPKSIKKLFLDFILSPNLKIVRLGRVRVLDEVGL